ncbi:PAS domain-containing sensor histidine kinase [Argonema antarcticum]|uniref:PAS domain-containing sensor histidine kinase n=1 Tax=Argonema antarcticum TaxID=2942763 RepID=UPI0020122815|nr:PAS domain S-box protein [Argonema antarcticum]MCL1473414.1 PAS domain S-box protein [Argonema antarcticum A004/B2]
MYSPDNPELLHLFLEHIPSAVAMCDRNMRYLFASRRWLTDFGLSDRDIIGRSHDEILPDLSDNLRWKYQRCLAEAVEESQEDFIVKSDGSIEHLKCKIHPWRTSTGEIGGAIILADAIAQLSLSSIEEITDLKRIEAELIKERDFSEAVLEACQIFVVTVSADGKTLTMNPSMLNALGYTLEEVVGTDYLQTFVPEDEHQKLLQILEDCVRTHQPNVHSNRVLTKNGQELLVEWRGQLALKDNGEFNFLIAFGIDITSSKALEKELALRQARFDAFFNASPAGLCIFDDEMRYIQVNPTLAENSGRTPADLIGKRMSEALPHLAPKLEPGYRHILTTGKSIINEEISGETPSQPGILRHWVTSKFPLFGEESQPIGVGVVVVEITQLKQAEKALREYQEGLEDLVFARTAELQIANQQLLEEIVERQQIEAALRESEEQFRATFEQAAVGICHARTDGRLLQVNQKFCDILGYTQEELIGVTFMDITHPDDLNINLELMRQLLANEIQTFSLEKRYICKNGSLSWVNLTVSLVRELPGKPKYLIAVIQDISDRKQAELALQESEAREREKATLLETTLRELRKTQSQLIQSEKMSSLGQLVAGVAHEINNPVNFIYGNLIHVNNYTQDLLKLLQLYQQESPNPTPRILEEIEAIDLDFLTEDLPKILSSMKVGAERIREIVLSLRNFSRLDEAAVKKVDIHEGIDSTLMILQNRLKAKSNYPEIQLIKAYGNLPKIECYAGQLNQVFMNILTNAIDALEEGQLPRRMGDGEEFSQSPIPYALCPTIWIGTETIGDRAVIRIADNGPGMTQEVLDKLFDPFFTTKPIGRGTGLGLSVSYQIVVEKHKGQLHYTSQLAVGTEFIIEIPIRQS